MRPPCSACDKQHMDTGTFQQSLRESQDPRQRQAQLPARPRERALLPRAGRPRLPVTGTGGTSGTAPPAALQWPWGLSCLSRAPLALLYTANTKFLQLQLVKSRTERQLHLSPSRITLTAGPKMPTQGTKLFLGTSPVPRAGCALPAPHTGCTHLPLL